MPVSVSRAATLEVASAAEGLETARRGYGQRLREAYNTALRRLDETPQFFPPEEDAPAGYEVRYVELTRYNYRVIFAVLGELKLVVAVAHNSQQPGYWLERLPPAGGEENRAHRREDEP